MKYEKQKGLSKIAQSKSVHISYICPDGLFKFACRRNILRFDTCTVIPYMLNTCIVYPKSYISTGITHVKHHRSLSKKSKLWTRQIKKVSYYRRKYKSIRRLSNESY